MKRLILLLSLLTSFCAFSQKYPRIETDSSGQKLVVMTYQQAQKIDNSFEMLRLLEKANIDCDSLSLSYVRVIDQYKNRVVLLETDLLLYKGQVSDKDSQILNLQSRLQNCELSSQASEKQIETRDQQIILLKDEVKSLKIKRNISYGVGIAGVIAGILLLFALN